MTDAEDAPGTRPAGAETAHARAAREHRRRQVFGDVLDGSTLDDRPEASEGTPAPPTGAAPAASDRWLQENVPPHHGG